MCSFSRFLVPRGHETTRSTCWTGKVILYRVCKNPADTSLYFVKFLLDSNMSMSHSSFSLESLLIQIFSEQMENSHAPPAGVIQTHCPTLARAQPLDEFTSSGQESTRNPQWTWLYSAVRVPQLSEYSMAARNSSGRIPSATGYLWLLFPVKRQDSARLRDIMASLKLRKLSED